MLHLVACGRPVLSRNATAPSRVPFCCLDAPICQKRAYVTVLTLCSSPIFTPVVLVLSPAAFGFFLAHVLAHRRVSRELVEILHKYFSRVINRLDEQKLAAMR